MKKYLTILCAISLIICSMTVVDTAFAASKPKGVNIDFSTATDKELEEAIRLIQEELNSRANNSRTRGNNVSDVGKTITNSDGVSFTVLSVKQSKGSGYYKPESGNVFVQLEIEIVNNSKKEVSVNAIYGFEAICDDYSVDYSFTADCSVNNGISTTDIKAGRKLKGWKAFEVPKNWKELIVTFTPDYSFWGGGEEIEVYIYNK